MDEAYNLINARLSMSYVNIYAGHIAFQIRKTATLIFITMTQLRTVDILYREEWDYRIYCERLPNEEEDWRLWDFLFEIHDKRREKFTTWTVNYETAEKIFDSYNTNEIIQPRYKSRIEYEFLISDPKILAQRSLDIAKKIKPILRTNTKDEIEWGLKRSGFDKCWKNDVYIEFKHLLLEEKMNT